MPILIATAHVHAEKERTTAEKLQAAIISANEDVKFMPISAEENDNYTLYCIV
jgi:hypothetical protein